MGEYSDLLREAMEITDQSAADWMFERLVACCMKGKPLDQRSKCEEIQRANLGYFAGYYDTETRARVERLFQCAHPIFGAIAEKGAPTPEEAFEMGRKLGEQIRREKTT